MRTIKVTGRGELKLRPDLTRVTAALSGKYGEYAETLERSSADTEKLKDMLASFGFERAGVKTVDFSVDAEFESRQEDGEYRQKLVGYRYRHTVKVEFEPDNERLGKLLHALAASDLEPEFTVAYTVKDPEKARGELLAKAVADAREKAEILARSAGLTLKEIASVDYSYGGADAFVRPTARMAAFKAADAQSFAFGADMNPDDVNVSDAVTVVWETV